MPPRASALHALTPAPDPAMIGDRSLPPCGQGYRIWLELSRALMPSRPRTSSQRVVPANAGTHNPWLCLLRKVSAPMLKREDTAYGSLLSQGRLVETSRKTGKNRVRTA